MDTANWVDRLLLSVFVLAMSAVLIDTSTVYHEWIVLKDVLAGFAERFLG